MKITIKPNTNIQMKKNLMFAFIVLFLSVQVKAQSNSVTLNLGKKATIKQLIQTKDSGFMVLTGYAPKYGYSHAQDSKDFMMRCYYSKLNELWNYEPGQDWYPNFASSDKTDFKYWFTYQNDHEIKVMFNNSSKPTIKKQINFTRFNKNGFVDKLNLKIEEDSKEYNLISAFSDKEQFHLITNNIMTGISDKNKVPEVPYIYSLNHKDGKKFTNKKININLSKGGTFGYIGIYEDKIYLYQQRLENLDVVGTTIFIINNQGELLKEFELMNKASNGKYFKVVSYKREFFGDFVNNYSYSPHSQEINYLTENCLSELKVDFKNNSIHFISFLTESKKHAEYGSQSAEVSHIYISKFNLLGEKIKSKEISYVATVESSSESLKSMKNSNVAAIKLYEQDKFVTKVFGEYGKSMTYFLTLKETKVIDVSEVKLYNDIEFINNNYQVGLFANLEQPQTFKNKDLYNHITSLTKKDFKSASYLALNTDKNYFLFKFSEINNQNVLEVKLFD